ncbi:hypothetical protein [Sediminispirochaeta smaragdinae]|jgi:hypothetical protein|uniref:Uncharacterized protein n=1 Tax=Sediminispirochaeta smaragdinae (strain DSM 11293 / JCM 15392 / SEBR 4228) TaxID=573413 RepID=E1R3E6_SEDSS|nr:hypothetical protein [Sediminispirochaeta smaragdinae]ADK81577.1 conserved hypothetical protein [Sediminispirochaeta smaragdinae DSM 11293]
MVNPQMEEWEDFLKKSFDEIDEALENRYGQLYPLHPNRPAKGETASKSRDGLFNVGAAFSPGFGSEHGRGWVVEVDMVTLAKVPKSVQSEIEETVASMLQEKIETAYPGRGIRIARDGTAFKIYGNIGVKYRL